MKIVKTFTGWKFKYKLVQLDPEEREGFPETDKKFKLKFKKKTYELWVNSSDSFRIAQLFDDYEFKEGDQLTIKSKSDGSFEATVS